MAKSLILREIIDKGKKDGKYIYFNSLIVTQSALRNIFIDLINLMLFNFQTYPGSKKLVDFEKKLKKLTKMDGDGLSKEVKDELRFQTFVFFDLEATGLPSDTRPPRITELCFKALDVEHFSALKPLLQMYK